MKNNTLSPSQLPQLSKPPVHYGVFVAFIAIIGAFSSLVNDMYLPTMPAMMREFHTTTSMTQMGISMAMAGMGLGSLVWGSTSDRYGRKPILIISLLIFVVATGVSLLSRRLAFLWPAASSRASEPVARWFSPPRYLRTSTWGASSPN